MHDSLAFDDSWGALIKLYAVAAIALAALLCGTSLSRRRDRRVLKARKENKAHKTRAIRGFNGRAEIEKLARSQE